MTQNKSQRSPVKTLSSRIVWSSPWYRVRQDEIVLPDQTLGVYNVVEHPGAVWVIPVTSDGKIVMLYHYRYTVDDWCWEIPAGGLKTGATLEETALEELREEVGGKSSHKLEYFGRFYTANGICNEVANIFIAWDVTIGEPAHEPAEIIEVKALPIAKVLRMAHANEISDGPSALALLLCESRLLEVAKQ